MRWLVLWRVLRSGLWRVLLWLLLWQLLADTRRPKADCAYAF